MRNKKAFYNIIANLLLQIVVAISGLLLPRFYLLIYGSSINGMVSSVTQFMAYLALVEAGISSAAIVNLYKPLAESNVRDINIILSASRKFYLQSGFFYTLLVIGLTLVYPYFIDEQIGNSTTQAIIVILSLSNLIDYLLLGKYRVLLMADQKGYIVIVTQIIGTVLNTIVSMILMNLKLSIVCVKFVATVVYLLRSFLIIFYVKKNYGYINFHEKTKENVLPQRGSVLIHQIAGVVLNNTNLVILTIVLGSNSLLEISVYTIYQMIANLIITVVGSLMSALNSGFGEIIAQNDKKTLFRVYSTYEFAFNIILFTCYICLALLYMPFISLYTANIVDVNYIRPQLICLFTLSGFFQCVRVPAITIITAAGHYTQTQKRAILEAFINIIVALLLVKPLGIIGVLIGTLCAYIFSATMTIIYCNNNLLKGTIRVTCIRLIRNLFIVTGYMYFIQTIDFGKINSYGVWFVYAMIVGVTSFVFISVINCICEPEQSKDVFLRIKSLVRKRTDI